jgi:hypothetical protein
MLPWCIAAIAALGYFAGRANPVFARGELGTFLVGLAGFAFILGVLVLAALPVSIELQERTLLLFFSQPEDRLRLWTEKIRAAAIAVAGLGVVHGLASAATGQLTWSEAGIYSLFVITAIASVGFYTLAIRSIMVGIVLAVGMPFAIAGIFCLITYLVFGRILGMQIEFSESLTVVLELAGWAIYSACLFWLSRRQFMELELRDGPVSVAAEIPAAFVPRKLSALIRPRPAGATANLIRKEICLQRPIFLVSAVFVACWLVTLLLMIVRPAWQKDLVAVLHALTGMQIVLMVFLTGCVSLGDDKALGTTAWHLTLPISALRQWLIKLLVAGGTLIATAVMLPILLAGLSLFEAKVGLLAMRAHAVPGFLTVGGLVFLVGFWAASMSNNTVRAALGTIVAIPLFGLSIMLAYVLAERSSGIGTLTGAPDFSSPTMNIITTLAIAGLVTLGLVQSYREFRRVDSRRLARLGNCGILIVAIFGLTFWRTYTFALDVMRELGPVNVPTFKSSTRPAVHK